MEVLYRCGKVELTWEERLAPIGMSEADWNAIGRLARGEGEEGSVWFFDGTTWRNGVERCVQGRGMVFIRDGMDGKKVIATPRKAFPMVFSEGEWQDVKSWWSNTTL